MAMKGPLAPWAPGMALRLETLGYTPRMVHVHLQFAGTFSRFLLRHGVTAGDVSPELIEQFVTGAADEEHVVAADVETTVVAGGIPARRWGDRPRGCS